MPVAVRGDTDFIAGADVTKYVIRDLNGDGPYRVEASLHYQVLGSRYADELLVHDVPEMKEFAELYATADARPELLARTQITVQLQGETDGQASKPAQ